MPARSRGIEGRVRDPPSNRGRLLVGAKAMLEELLSY